jgi:integrase
MAASVKFAEAAASYLEHGGEAAFLGRENPTTGKWSGLIGHFMGTPLDSIGQVEADEAARKLFPTASSATRKRQAYGPLIAVLNHAAIRGWTHAPKIHAPKVVVKPPKWATPEYVQTLLAHCGPRLRRFVIVIVYTGARLSEVLRLDWDRDVDLSTRLLTFRRTKNGKMRTAHIPDPLLAELAKVPEDERHGLLFTWTHKSHVRRPLMTAAKRAGLEYLTVHQLGRHTFATWLRIYAKRDLVGLQADGGWDSIASVARYAHVVPGETAKAVDLLPDVQTGAPTDTDPPKDRILKRKLDPRSRVGKG